MGVRGYIEMGRALSHSGNYQGMQIAFLKASFACLDSLRAVGAEEIV